MNYNDLKNTVWNEHIQKKSEGAWTDGFEELFNKADNEEKLLELYEKVHNQKVREEFKYYEPDDYESILKERKNCVDAAFEKISDGKMLDKFLGAWQGRIAGCALGKPVEYPPFNCGDENNRAWEYIKLYCQNAKVNYPLDDFLPFESGVGLKLSPWCKGCTKDNISHMEPDDDIRYTILGLLLTERYGKDFGSFEVGKLWLEKLPYRETYTAESAAYYNFITLFPYAGEKPKDWETNGLQYVRKHFNPFREWIGAQIRADGIAYSCATNPSLAAKLCYEDASLSHCKNGVYGEMFFGAVISAAFAESDIDKLTDIGLSYIPHRSRLYEDILFAREVAKSCSGYEDMIKRLYDKLGHYSCVHTNNNAALCVASLVFADGDFEKAIGYAVSGGWDTDCNGATVGSIMGAILGAEKLPKKWVEVFNDTLYSNICDFHPISIKECAQRSFEVYKDFTNGRN